MIADDVRLPVQHRVPPATFACHSFKKFAIGLSFRRLKRGVFRSVAEPSRYWRSWSQDVDAKARGFQARTFGQLFVLHRALPAGVARQFSVNFSCGHCDPPNWSSPPVVDPLRSGVSSHPRSARGRPEGFQAHVERSCASRRAEFARPSRSGRFWGRGHIISASHTLE